MCGIIGYTGYEAALPKIIKGLYALEYRGYDSCGATYIENGIAKTVKAKGRVRTLDDLLDKDRGGIFASIGHTRWATHGEPSDVNAHPHCVGRVCLVHNGIIENYSELKSKLQKQGYVFLSETDTEVGCALIDFYLRENAPQRAIKEAILEMRGSYAFGIIIDGEEKIYAVRKNSPLVIAKGADGYYLCSDITALTMFKTEYYLLNEGDVAEITRFGARVNDREITEWKKSEITYESTEKQGFSHYMLKEIYEQPVAIEKTLNERIENGQINLPLGLSELLKTAASIDIVACGSAMNAGLVGKWAIEKIAGVRTNVYVASEYRYTPPINEDGRVVIAISQSGETADTLACVKYARSVGQRTVAIVNVKESSIAREADYTLYTQAGPEIAVATTKGYTTQIALLYLLAVSTASAKGKIDKSGVKNEINSLYLASKTVQSVLQKRESIQKIARDVYENKNVFFIGRGIDYPICQEGTLKLKEISYIHSEAYASGELKHGTISLVERGTPVIAIATEQRLLEKTEANLGETKSRGAYTILITTEGAKFNDAICDTVFEIPAIKELFTAHTSFTSDYTVADATKDAEKRKIATELDIKTVDHSSFSDTLTEKSAVISFSDPPLISQILGAASFCQLLSFEVANLLGKDIDKPRNLAKSVTVE